MGAGKSTTAARVGALHPATVRMSFATAVKDTVHRLWELPRSPKPRDRYIAVAEALRAVDPDVWVGVVARAVDALPDDTPIVIDDLRFPHEAEALVARGFLLVQCTLPDAVRWGRMAAVYGIAEVTRRHAPFASHVSERGLHTWVRAHPGAPTAVCDTTSHATVAAFLASLGV